MHESIHGGAGRSNYAPLKRLLWVLTPYQGTEIILTTMQSFTIGQLANRASVNVETIRFYERKGLIGRPERGDTYRQYPAEVVQTILFIKQAKNLGFTLVQIKELLFLRLAQPTDCQQVKRKTELKLEEVRTKIKALRKMERVLFRLAETCMAEEQKDGCPILEALEDEVK